MITYKATDNLVLWSTDAGIGRITLNRPQQANAIDLATARALADVIVEIAKADVRAVLISAHGDYFCVGGDIREFIEQSHRLDGMVDNMLEFMHPAIHKLASLPVPVVSAVNGPTGGAGIALALCADIVLAADTAKLRGGYSAIGLTPDLGASYYLTRRVGAAKAKKILFLNQAVTAQECLSLGIVDQIHPAADLQQTAEALVQQLAAGATKSYGGIKHLCDSAFNHSLQDHLALEQKLLMSCAQSADVKEGITAFMEKRPPRFAGK